MTKRIGLIAFMGTLSFASAAAAQDSGFELGARLGYGIPLGKATGEGDDALSESISGKIPLQLDVGYRLDPQLFIGGYFQYGFGFVGDAGNELCDMDGVSCSTNVVRLGAQLTYHFNPITVDGAWLGAGIGYEWLNFSTKGFGQSVSGQARGFEFINFQGGYDFVVADKFRVGPFALLTVGQYGTQSASAGGDTVSTSDFDKAIHSWLVLGVKGSFGAL